MLVLFSLFILFVNALLYASVKEKGLKMQALLIVGFFLFMVVCINMYDHFIYNDGMPSGLSFFVILCFSLGILLLHFIKGIIVGTSSIIGENIITVSMFLKFTLFMVTLFQLVMILSGAVYSIK